MNRDEYARRWSSGNDHPGFVRVDSVDVPDDIERVDCHTPCTFCGVRAGLPCRHRRWAA